MRVSERWVTRECEQCGAEFERYKGHIRKPTQGRFCSIRCNADWRQANSGASSYSSVFDPQHPLARKTDGRVFVHRKVLYDAIGPGQHPCHWCGTTVEWRLRNVTSAGGLVVDHIDRDRRNNDLSNLVPSCHGCNARRDHPDNIKDGETVIVFQGAQHRSKRAGDCLTCGKPTYVLLAETRPNRGRYCSVTCARRAPRKPRDAD